MSIFKIGRKYCEQIVANSCQVFMALLAMVVVGHAGPAQGTVDPHIDVQFWPVSWSLPAIHPDHVSSPNDDSANPTPALWRYVTLSHHLSDATSAAARHERIQTNTSTAGPFGSVLLRIASPPTLGRWGPISEQVAISPVDICSQANGCSRIERRLAAAIAMAKGVGFAQRLAIINAKVNQLIQYESDYSAYRVADHWAGPGETLARGRGDCEDYAILKMAALRAAGVPVKSMSMVVLLDRRRNLFHAILLVSTDKGRFVLDNLRNTVAMDTEFADYQPLFSMSEDRAWIHGVKKGSSLTVAGKMDFVSVAPGTGAAAENPAPRPRP